LAHAAKTTTATISYLETGKKRTKPETLQKVAEVLGMTLSFSLQDAPTNPAEAAPAPPAPSASEAPPQTDLAATIAQAVAQAVAQTQAESQAQLAQAVAQAVGQAMAPLAQAQARADERQAQMMQAQAQLAEALAKHADDANRRFDGLSDDCGKVKAGLEEVKDAVEDLAEHERGILKKRVDRLEQESHQERAEGGTVLGAA
jgi:transcriptional regulator with XRE-family HTH domain